MCIRSRSLSFPNVKNGHHENSEHVVAVHLFRSYRKVLCHARINQQVIERRLFSSKEGKKKKAHVRYLKF